MNPTKNKNRKAVERFRAEIWDQMQFFFQEYNEYIIYIIILLCKIF